MHQQISTTELHPIKNPTGKCADIISADVVFGIKIKDRVLSFNWYSSNL